MNDSNTSITDTYKVKFKTICGEKYWVPVDVSEKLEKDSTTLKNKLNLTSATLEEIFRTLHIPQGDMGAFENYVNKSYDDSKELEAIRAVFDHGANDDLWEPGTTLAEAVKSLKEKYIKYNYLFELQTKHVADLEMRLVKMEEQLKSE